MPSHRSFSFCPDLGASLRPCIAIVGCLIMRSKIWQSELRSICTHKSGRSGNKILRFDMSFDSQSIFHSLEISPQMEIIAATISHLQMGSFESAQRRKVMRWDGEKQKQGRDCRAGKESLPVSVTKLMPHHQELERPFQK